MTIFFSSDHHFGHTNIIRYANRPFSSVEEMNETLIENHNKIVKPGDEVFFLGDFSFLREEDTIKIIKRLNGQKNLILGNHDRGISEYSERYIDNKLFRTISNYKKINRYGQKIILFHYSLRAWDCSHRSSWALWGHSHGSLKPYGKSVDVGVDSKYLTDEYRPVSFEEVKIFMDKQEMASADYGY